MVDEILIMDYDPEWLRLYEKERALICSALGDTVADIQHVGSTAVPGLVAKPVIDILIGVRDLSLDEKNIEALSEIGYEYRGEAGIPGRLFFRKGMPRTHHVHVAVLGGEFWTEHLLFRDYLRAHPEEALRYADLKRDLAARLRTDRASYTESKAPFISSILAKARMWRQTARLQTDG